MRPHHASGTPGKTRTGDMITRTPRVSWPCGMAAQALRRSLKGRAAEPSLPDPRKPGLTYMSVHLQRMQAPACGVSKHGVLALECARSGGALLPVPPPARRTHAAAVGGLVRQG